MTPEEMAASSNGPERDNWTIDPSRTPREVLRFIKESPADSRSAKLAKSALNIRLAEDAGNQAKQFEQQMDKLIGIADAQRLLAEKLDRQTNTVIALTRALVVFTIVIVGLTIVLILKGG